MTEAIPPAVSAHSAQPCHWSLDHFTKKSFHTTVNWIKWPNNLQGTRRNISRLGSVSFLSFYLCVLCVLCLYVWMPCMCARVCYVVHACLYNGARKQVQGGAFAPPGFFFSIFCITLFIHRVWHRDTAILFSAEWNTTADIGVPQVETRL